MTIFNNLIFGASGTMAYMTAASEARRSSMSGLYPPSYRVPPLFDVALVTPSYMETKYLGSLLRTARNQTMPFKRIIVADSSPPEDGTKALARDYGAEVVELPSPTGPGDARNAGAARALDADMIVFADADVMLPSDFVEHVTEALEYGYAAVHPKETFHDSVFWNALFYPYSWIFRARRLTKCCVGVWRSVFDSVGGYDSQCDPFEGCSEDLDFGSRIMDAFGSKSVGILNCGIAISARRQKSQGLFRNWATPVRGYYR